jgi:hypothetical protein
MPNIGLGLSIGSSGNALLNSISSQAQSWNTRAGSPLNATQLALFDTYFFKPMINNGLFDKFDRLNLFGLNGLGSKTLALTNTIKTAHTVIEAGAPTFGVYGFSTTSSSNYLNLNYTPSTQAVKLSQNSITQFAVIRNPTFITAARFMGARVSNAPVLAPVNTRLSLIRDITPQLTANLSATSAASNTNTVVSGNVFLGAVRSASNASVAYINKNAGSTSIIASVNLPTVSVYELIENENNGAPGPVDNNFPHLASGHGQALTVSEIGTLQDILNGLWIALGL